MLEILENSFGKFIHLFINTNMSLIHCSSSNILLNALIWSIILLCLHRANVIDRAMLSYIPSIKSKAVFTLRPVSPRNKLCVLAGQVQQPGQLLSASGPWPQSTIWMFSVSKNQKNPTASAALSRHQENVGCWKSNLPKTSAHLGES